MPNWSYNRFAIKGKTSDVLQVINDAITNSVRYRNEFGTPIQVEPQTDINEAFNKLLEIGCDLVADFGFGDENVEATPKICENICMGTFRPIPLTYLKYDTTNHPERFPDAAKEQRETYGAVGWYDYNRNIAFGCKWDTELTDLSLYTDGEYSTITFCSDTPWCTPDLWLEYLKGKYPVCGIFICANEESGMYYFYGEVDNEEIDCSSDIQDKINAAVGDDDDEDDWELRTETEEEAIEEMVNDFFDYVSDYKIGA